MLHVHVCLVKRGVTCVLLVNTYNTFTATSSGGVPTAAALKAGVGFPLGLRRQGRLLSSLHPNPLPPHLIDY